MLELLFWLLKDTLPAADSTLVPRHDHPAVEQSNSYWYFTNQQVVIDADTHPSS